MERNEEFIGDQSVGDIQAMFVPEAVSAQVETVLIQQANNPLEPKHSVPAVRRRRQGDRENQCMITTAAPIQDQVQCTGETHCASDLNSCDVHGNVDSHIRCDIAATSLSDGHLSADNHMGIAIASRRRHVGVENRIQDATADKLSDGQAPGVTLPIAAIVSDSGALPATVLQPECSPAIAEIIQLWRMRQRWHRAEKSLILQGRAFCRHFTKGDKDAANKLFDTAEDGGDVPHDITIALIPFLPSIQNFRRERTAYEKQLRKLSRSLPIWSWVADIKGFGDLNLAAIVGEAGDISNYRNPSCLWKRMGLAVINGERQRKKTNPDEALAHGYNPNRRCVSYLLGDCLVKAGAACRYRPLYDERKAKMLAKFEAMQAETDKKIAPKAHSHNDAMRIMTKRVLRDLWVAWRKMGLCGL